MRSILQCPGIIFQDIFLFSLHALPRFENIRVQAVICDSFRPIKITGRNSLLHSFHSDRTYARAACGTGPCQKSHHSPIYPRLRLVKGWMSPNRKKGGKTASRNGQAWSSPSPRGQWRTEKKWRKPVVKSSVVPQRSSRLRGRWRRRKNLSLPTPDIAASMHRDTEREKVVNKSCEVYTSWSPQLDLFFFSFPDFRFKQTAPSTHSPTLSVSAEAVNRLDVTEMVFFFFFFHFSPNNIYLSLRLINHAGPPCWSLALAGTKWDRVLSLCTPHHPPDLIFSIVDGPQPLSNETI